MQRRKGYHQRKHVRRSVKGKKFLAGKKYRYVFGSRTNKWHRIGKTDRDYYVWGVSKKNMELIKKGKKPMPTIVLSFGEWLDHDRYLRTKRVGKSVYLKPTIRKIRGRK